ncbi:MAG TPA: kelch repeat-containing protein, partial [Labilithrix sp.]|nr:kelch repeat-containing protein [Labilithrix sp.]
IFAIGGWEGAPRLSTVVAYTPNTNTWSKVPSMPTARWGLAAAVGADGRIFAIGGNDFNSELSTVEAYTP